MIRTRVGYTGGQSVNPTYRNLGNHTESFQVDFEPSKVSFDDLLALFWNGHSPFTSSHGAQYKPAVFCNSDEQLAAAEASKASLQAESGNTVYTEILPLTKFYRAEDYHQKYYLRHNRRLMAELETIFQSEQEFTDSTLAARLSAYSSNHGYTAVLESELASYGLSEANTAYLRELALGLDEGTGGLTCGLAQ